MGSKQNRRPSAPHNNQSTDTPLSLPPSLPRGMALVLVYGKKKGLNFPVAFSSAAGWPRRDCEAKAGEATSRAEGRGGTEGGRESESEVDGWGPVQRR